MVSNDDVLYELWSVAAWNQNDVGAQHSVSDPWTIASGSLLSSWTQNNAFKSGTGSIEGADDYGSGPSYVIEGAFLLDGADVVNNVSTDWMFTGFERIHWTMECGNDHLEFTTNSVPEPATMMLLGTGLLGLVAIGRKKFIK